MILSNQSIRSRCMDFERPMVTPYVGGKQVFDGMSYGTSHAGYDIRVAQDIVLYPVNLTNLFINALPNSIRKFLKLQRRPSFTLASSVEHFQIPNDVLSKLCDKSTLARMGLAVQNTVMEPGWTGWLTLELANVGEDVITLRKGSPIGQMIFYELDYVTEVPYSGKYQNQANRPVEPIKERS